MTAVWDFFDKIYCISLSERPDRRRDAADQFNKVQLSRRVEFLIVPKHATDCEQGIYESHMTCLEKGIAAGAAHILVFEDDICFEGFSPQALGEAVTFLSDCVPWHLFFLGCMVHRIRPTPCPAVNRVRFRSLNHAYAVHREFAQQLIRHPWQGISYDAFIHQIQTDHTYAAYPPFAFQSESRSDNEQYLWLDRIRRCCGGLRRLQKANHFCHRNRFMLMAAHGVALLLLLMLIKA